MRQHMPQGAAGRHSPQTPPADEELKGEFFGAERSQLPSYLSKLEREVVILYFGLEEQTALTLSEIAQILELPIEEIRKLKENALQKMRSAGRP